MYCYHCGYKLKEHDVEMEQSSFDMVKDQIVDDDVQIQYICPRCGRIIRAGMTHEDSKALSRASHAQVQRGNNSFATGMCLNSLGIILLIISIVFLLLSNKPEQGLVTNCGEFYVSVATMILSVILLVSGIVLTIRGLSLKTHYTRLLKDLNNQTFVQ